MSLRANSSNVGAAVAAGIFWLSVSGAAAQERQDGVAFDYSYERPGGLQAVPLQVPLATALPGPKYDIEQSLALGERKARGLVEALGVRLASEAQTREVDEHGEVLRIRDGRYRVKVYAPSGMITFRDTALYNRDLEDERLLPAMSAEAALEKTRALLDGFARAGLLDADQLLFEAAHFSHRNEQNVRGAERGETGRPEVGPAVRADTRVFVPRAVNGIGVSGHGVQVTYSRSGEVAGLDFFWRELAFEEPPLRVRFTLDEAKARFEDSLQLPRNARVDVLVSDLVYFDPSKRDPVAFLEPAYLFVYRVDVSLPDSEEFAVSKILHRVFPAVAHGRTQLDPPRALRQKHFGQAEVQRSDEDDDLQSDER